MSLLFFNLCHLLPFLQQFQLVHFFTVLLEGRLRFLKLDSKVIDRSLKGTSNNNDLCRGISPSAVWRSISLLIGRRCVLFGTPATRLEALKRGNMLVPRCVSLRRIR